MEQLVVVPIDQLEDLIRKTVRDVFAEQEAAPFNYKAAAKYLNLSPNTLRNFVSKNRIPHQKVGNRVFFYKEELREWSKQNKNEGPLSVNRSPSLKINIQHKDSKHEPESN